MTEPDQDRPKRRWGQPPPPSDFELERAAAMDEAAWTTANALSQVRAWLKKAHDARQQLLRLELATKPEKEMSADEDRELRARAPAVADADPIVIDLRRLMASARRVHEAAQSDDRG